MKILTWNINGIRASKVPLKELFDDLDADVICIQETKVTSMFLGTVDRQPKVIFPCVNSSQSGYVKNSSNKI